VIDRVRVSNYRCLVNFETNLNRECLLLGYNGAGKSTLIDSLKLIQDFVCGWVALADLITSYELTQWTTANLVEFEIDMHAAGGMYRYKLALDCNRQLDKIRIYDESLTFDHATLVRRDQNEVYLHRDDGSQGGSFPLDWSQSAVAAVQPSSVNQKLQTFRKSVGNWTILRPNVMSMESESRAEVNRPMRDLSNFTSWYRSLALNGKWTYELTSLMRNVWDDFSYINLEEIGREARALQLVFEAVASGGSTVTLYWQQLSDGERALLSLYSLVALVKIESQAVLILDEPDNNVALAEVKPWAAELLQSIGPQNQVIVASHHPELVEFMGENRALWLTRLRHDTPAVPRNLDQVDDGLTLSERIARGWIDG
jgi:predicted ATPase